MAYLMVVAVAKQVQIQLILHELQLHPDDYQDPYPPIQYECNQNQVLKSMGPDLIKIIKDWIS